MQTEPSESAPYYRNKPQTPAGVEQATTLLYFSALIAIVTFGYPQGSFFFTPIKFFLKSELHLNAEATSAFQFWMAFPVYFAFVCGFIRDSWNPFGLRDRGYFIIFGLLTAALYIGVQFFPITYGMLLFGMIILGASYRFISAAWNGLLALVGQRQLLSGAMSSIWNIVPAILGFIGLLVGGRVTNYLIKLKPEAAAHLMFTIGAFAIACVALFGLWKPRAIFAAEEEEQRIKPKSHFVQDVSRLVKHWPIYPALFINLLWNFAPGSDTPLQYYMSDFLKLQPSDFSNYQAAFSISFIPTFIIYAFLCRKVPLKKLLFWGTIIGIPQMVPILFVHSATSAWLMAIPIGLMGGIASAAYIDLAIRSCPAGLQGTLMMLVDGMLAISARAGDMLGTKIFDVFGKDSAGHTAPEIGFKACVWAIVIVYFLILPLILLVPKRLIQTADGEPLPGGEDFEHIGDLDRGMPELEVSDL